jgi:hypothetical protein
LASSAVALQCRQFIYELFVTIEVAGGQPLRIEPRPQGRKNHVVREVRRAHALGPIPDPVCCSHCANYRVSTGCHRFCPAAPWRLSSEGERSPVEPRVAPLVFELKKLGVFHPCWSCEGHPDSDGKVWKIPCVWFYADSVVHIRGLADAVATLFNARRLAARWEIVLTYSDPDNPDTTFSLQPELGLESCLSTLQSDLRAMADDLGSTFWLACDALAAQAR